MPEWLESEELECEGDETPQDFEVPVDQIVSAVKTKLALIDAGQVMKGYDHKMPTTNGLQRLLHSEQLKVGGVDVNIAIHRKNVKYLDATDGLFVDIKLQGSEDSYIASFDFMRHQDGVGEKWNMKHRKVEGEFEGKGLASSVLIMTERMLYEREFKTRRQQSISANVAQPSVIKWLLAKKRGFTPASQKDMEMLARIKKMDRLVCINDYLFDEEKFKSDFPHLSGPADPEVWAVKNIREEYFFRHSAYRLELKKQIS